ncbi:MAG: cation:proton antiporter, partial [Bryobacterales bacterium]
AAGVLPGGALLSEVLLLGLTFLVFVAGTELSPLRVGAQRQAAVKIGLAQFFLICGIGFAVALQLGFEWTPALYMGLALTASSTLVVLDILRQRQQFFEPFGRLVVGVLLVQDVLIILFITGLGSLDEGPSAIARSLAGIAGLVLATWAWARWLVPLLMLRLKLDEEAQLLLVLANLFLFLGSAQFLGLPLPAGAFLAGVSLSAFPINGIVRGQMSSLFDFFLALFFVTLGATLDVPNPDTLSLALALTLLVLLVTPPLVTLISFGAGLSARTGIEGGLLLAQCSEFSLVLGLVGMGNGHITMGLLAVVAFVTVVTMILTPFIATDTMTWRLMRLIPSGRRVILTPRPHDHVLLLGCGPNTRQLLDALAAQGQHVVVVDDDPAVVERLRSEGFEAVRGDGADYHLLRIVGARRARVIISTMRRVQDNERVARFLHGQRLIVRAFAPEQAERLRAAGATPVLFSTVAVEDFLRWFGEDFNSRRELSSRA